MCWLLTRCPSALRCLEWKSILWTVRRPITNAVTFTPAPGLLTSNTLTYSGAPNMYGAAFLDSTVLGVSGQAIIGTISVTLPPNVTANSAYLVHVDHFSASPNGIALFHSTTQDGLITVSDRSGSSWNDGILRQLASLEFRLGFKPAFSR